VLRDLTVRHAYSRQTRLLSTKATLSEAVQQVMTGFQADFPICDGDRLLGVLTYKNLIDALQNHEMTVPVSVVMTTDMEPLSPDDDLAGDLTPVWRTPKMSDRLIVRSERWATRNTPMNSNGKC
jgi:predicted transcriptional regulator